MTKSELFQWYKDLPPWARGVIIVGGSAVVVYTGYSVVKSINDKKKKAAAQAEVIGIVNDLNTLGNEGINPSFQQSQYQQWADSIAQQFSGCDTSSVTINPMSLFCKDPNNPSCYSNSGAVVLNIITQFNNDADFLALLAAFGTRTISKHFWCGGDYNNVTLSAAIADQLNTGEVAGLNQVLKAKGLTKSF